MGCDGRLGGACRSLLGTRLPRALLRFLFRVVVGCGKAWVVVYIVILNSYLHYHDLRFTLILTFIYTDFKDEEFTFTILAIGTLCIHVCVPIFFNSTRG